MEKFEDMIKVEEEKGLKNNLNGKEIKMLISAHDNLEAFGKELFTKERDGELDSKMLPARKDILMIVKLLRSFFNKYKNIKGTSKNR